MITIIDSTNIFDNDYQSFKSILDGDIKNSKIVFSSDAIFINDLTFLVELYFNDDLIFNTIVPTLYQTDSSKISNIDLSSVIRTYFTDKIGIKNSDNIEYLYSEYLKINNTGKIIIKEIDNDNSYDDTNILSIKNLSMWFDVNSGITVDSDGLIQSWVDRFSNKSLDAVNADLSSESYASLDNGLIHWKSGDVNNYFKVDNVNIVNSYNEFTIFTVNKYISGKPNILTKTNTDASDNIKIYSGGKYYIDYDNDTDSWSVDIDYTTQSLVVSCFYQNISYANLIFDDFKNRFNFDDSNHKINYLDEYYQMIVLGDGDTHVSTDEILLGDIIIVRGSLDKIEIDNIRHYLNQKFNLTNNKLDTYIIKSTDRNWFRKDIFDDGEYQFTTDDIFYNRYFNKYYNYKTNNIDLSNSIFTNTITVDEQIFYFRHRNSNGQSFFYAESKDTLSYVYVYPKNNYIYNETTLLKVYKDIKKIDIFPRFDESGLTMLEYEYYNNDTGVGATGDDMDELNIILEDMNLDFFELKMQETLYNKYRFKFYDNCTKYPHLIKWFNRIDGYDMFNFDLIHKEEVQITNDGYYSNKDYPTNKINDNDLNISWLEYNRYYINKYTLRTDWLTFDQIFLLEDLLKSNEIYIKLSEYGKFDKWVALKNLTKTKTLFHKDIKGAKRYEIVVEEAIKKQII